MDLFLGLCELVNVQWAKPSSRIVSNKVKEEGFKAAAFHLIHRSQTGDQMLICFTATI